MTPSNLDLARECGATYDHQWVDEYVVAGLRFTPLQLDAFAESIRAQPSPAAVERKPLTHEQVLALIEAEGNAPEHRTMYDFARAIERAHGIDGIKAHQGGAA